MYLARSGIKNRTEKKVTNLYHESYILILDINFLYNFTLYLSISQEIREKTEYLTSFIRKKRKGKGGWLLIKQTKFFCIFFTKILLVGCTTIGSGRHRSINQALQANGDMLRLAGLPARGWYPKQRHARSAASTEHLDRLHQGSLRAWDTGTGNSRKPLTLPPNITPPKFFNKSPREALRRVTSLLIRKGNNTQADMKLLVV